MVIWCVFFLLTLGQIFLAKVLEGRLGRVTVWLILFSVLGLMHWLTLEENAFLRMIWLCSVLMAGMKMVVYREWLHRNEALTWRHWILFACFWFGMDPGAFRTRRRVEWKSHVLTGGGCLLTGLLGVYICYHLDIRNVVVLFICMSLAFHFGVLRLLTGFWRMQGFPVRVLFRNPLVMCGFRDFWGTRWNLAYSQMMARTVKKPLTPLIGEKWSMFVVFVFSGLVHELAITVPVGSGYGLPTAFFIVHGVVCCLEKKDTVIMGIICGVTLLAGLPYLFGEKFVEEIILPSRNVIEYFN